MSTAYDTFALIGLLAVLICVALACLAILAACVAIIARTVSRVRTDRELRAQAGHAQTQLTVRLRELTDALHVRWAEQSNHDQQRAGRQ